MIDFFEDFESEDMDSPFSLEDRESAEKAVELTREILRAPRCVRLEDAHSALVIWEHVYVYISDSQLGDRIGETIDLLEGIATRRKPGPEEVQEGLKALRFISQALSDRNGTPAFNDAEEGGLESDE